MLADSAIPDCNRAVIDHEVSISLKNCPGIG